MRMNEELKIETFDYALKNDDNHRKGGKKRYILLLLLLFGLGCYFFNKNSTREMIGLPVRGAERERKKHRPLNIKRKWLKNPRKHTSNKQIEDAKGEDDINYSECSKILGFSSKNEKLVEDNDGHCIGEKEALIFDQRILIPEEPLDDGISADEDIKPSISMPEVICEQSQMDSALKTETAGLKEDDEPAITLANQVEKLDSLTIEDKLNYIDLNFSFSSFIKNPKAVRDDLEKRKIFKITTVPISILKFLGETSKNKDDKQSIFAKVANFGRNLYDYSLNGGRVSRKKTRKDFKIWKNEIKEKIKQGIGKIDPSHKDVRAIDEIILLFMDSVVGKYVMRKNEQECMKNPADIKIDEHEPDNIEYCYDRSCDPNNTS